jgi:hypothetical protein
MLLPHSVHRTQWNLLVGDWIDQAAGIESTQEQLP